MMKKQGTVQCKKYSVIHFCYRSAYLSNVRAISEMNAERMLNRTAAEKACAPAACRHGFTGCRMKNATGVRVLPSLRFYLFFRASNPSAKRIPLLFFLLFPRLTSD
jgi:hypothetical protein